MRITLTLSALLIAASAFTMPALAADGHRFYEGAKSPMELADIIECDIDPARGGNVTHEKVINVAVCGKPGDRAHAAPIDYLPSLRRYGVDSVEKLIWYLRNGLEVDKNPPPGRFKSDCLTYSSKTTSGYMVFHRCVMRDFHRHEHVWRDKKTGDMVFMSDCTNPGVEEEIVENCVYADFYAKKSDVAVQIWINGKTEIDDSTCPLAVLRENGEWVAIDSDECPWEFQGDCDTLEIDNELPGYRLRAGTFNPEADRWYRVKGPKALLTEGPVADDGIMWVLVLCRKLANGLYTQAVGIIWSDYLPRARTWIATVFFDEQQAKEHDGRNVRGEPTDLWWRVWEDE